MMSRGLTLDSKQAGVFMSNLFDERPHRAAMAWLLGCTLLPLLAAGCGMDSGRVAEILPNRFNTVVLQSEQPILVNFYKPG